MIDAKANWHPEYLPDGTDIQFNPMTGNVQAATLGGEHGFRVYDPALQSEAVRDRIRRTDFDMQVVTQVAVGASGRQIRQVMGAEQDADVDSELYRTFSKFGITPDPRTALHMVDDHFGRGLLIPYPTADAIMSGAQHTKQLRKDLSLQSGAQELGLSRAVQDIRPENIEALRKLCTTYGLSNFIAARTLLLANKVITPFDCSRQQMFNFPFEMLDDEPEEAQRGMYNNIEKYPGHVFTAEEQVEEVAALYKQQAAILAGEPYQWRGATLKWAVPDVPHPDYVFEGMLYAHGYTAINLRPVVNRTRGAISKSAQKGMDELGIGHIAPRNISPVNLAKDGLLEVVEKLPALDPPMEPVAYQLLAAQALLTGATDIAKATGLSQNDIEKISQRQLTPAFGSRTRAGVIMGGLVRGLLNVEEHSR